VEKKLLVGAAACNWRRSSLQLFQDIIILMRDTGMRNERELYWMRIENLDWEARVIFVPDSKTEEGRRRVPMSNRVFDVLKQRCGEKREGWVFPSKRAASAHLTTMAKRFREARVKAGLPEDLVLYCGRHDYGTRILRRTGNLAAVMRTMGHKDGFEVIHVPGHCAGQVALLWRPGRMLFAADVCTNIMGLGDPVGFENLEEGRVSQRKLASLSFDAAGFGHGKPIARNASALSLL
jgi:Phage integrase family